MVRDGRHSRIRGSKKYGKIQTMGMSTLVPARQCTVSKRAIRAISSLDCRLAAQRGKGAEPKHPPEFCVFLHIWEMSEKVLVRGLTRPPKGGSATMATLRPSHSIRKVCSSVLEACTHTHQPVTSWTPEPACEPSSHLSLKEVVVEHVVVGELLLAVELSVSETSGHTRH